MLALRSLQKYSFFKQTTSQILYLSGRTKAIKTMSTSSTTYDFETLKVMKPSEYVFQVEMNRPEKRNAQNMTFYREMAECFNKLATDEDCRAIVITGAGQLFTSGIDLTSLAGKLMEEMEMGKKSILIRRFVKDLQQSFNSIEECPKPVLAAIHGACIGGGIDLITACDMRYCTQDAWFSIKEVDIGLAADLGTLQRLPKIVGNESLVRELAFTGRRFESDEAKEFGLVSRIFPDKTSLVKGALDMASLIAEKSPIAVQGTKTNLIYARDHSVAEAMDYVVTWNQSMLQSEDLMKAAMAVMNKEKPVFSKL